jgi:Dna[CI] antecedent, DciA
MKKQNSINEMLEKFFSRKKDLHDAYKLVQIQEIWGELGIDIIGGGFPVNFKKTILTIGCINSVWVQELSFKRVEIQKFVKSNINRIKLQKINFVIVDSSDIPALWNKLKTKEKTEKRELKISPESPAYKAYNEIIDKARESEANYSIFFENIATYYLTKETKSE